MALAAQLPLGAEGSRVSSTIWEDTRMAHDICSSGEPLGLPTCTTTRNSRQAEAYAGGACPSAPAERCSFGSGSLFDHFLRLRETLRRFLVRRLHDQALAADALQEVAVVAGTHAIADIRVAPGGWLRGVARKTALATLRRRGILAEVDDNSVCSDGVGVCMGDPNTVTEEHFVELDERHNCCQQLRAMALVDFDEALAYERKVESGELPMCADERQRQRRRILRLKKVARKLALL